MKSLDEELFIREENGMKIIILDLPKEDIRKKIFEEVGIKERHKLFEGDIDLYLLNSDVYRIEIYQNLFVNRANENIRNSYIGIENINGLDGGKWIIFDHESENEIPRAVLKKEEKLIIGKYNYAIGDERIDLLYFVLFDKEGYVENIDVAQVPSTYKMNVSFRSLTFICDSKGNLKILRNKNDPYIFIIRKKNGEKEEKILI